MIGPVARAVGCGLQYGDGNGNTRCSCACGVRRQYADRGEATAEGMSGSADQEHLVGGVGLCEVQVDLNGE